MTLHIFVNALGWSLIHSLWQAAIIFSAWYVSLKVFRQASSRIKYMLSCLALAGIFFCFLFTFYHLWSDQQRLQQAVTAPAGGFIPAGTANDIALSTASAGSRLWQPAMWINYLVLFYSVGLLFFAGKTTKDLFVMRHIRRSRVKPFDKAWEHYLDKLRISWKIPQHIKLFLSEYLDVPVVIGYLKPVIYLPLINATHFTAEQIEAILLHELAHIKRYDFIANIFQTFIETVLFFNPFVWIISKTIRRERENCCDDLVLSATRPALYAETLLALAENQLYKGSFVLAATGKKQQLLHRIKRIMEMKTKKLNIMQKLFVLFILAAGIASVSWLTPGKQSHHPEGPKITPLKAASTLVLKGQTDTLITPPPPPAPPASVSAQGVASPSVPVPPASVPAPPTPPVAPVAPADTFPDHFWNDSSFQHISHQMQVYFNSDAWKKYQQDLQKYQQHMQQYFQGKEWKEHQLALQNLSKQLSKMRESVDSSAQWRAYREAMKAETNKMREFFNNSTWKNGMDSLRQRLSRDRIHWDSLMVKNRMKFSFNTAQMDSLMADARKKSAMVKSYPFHMFLYSHDHTIYPKEIVRLMEQDGLIKNSDAFSIKLNEKGLYVNGKKQSRTYFEKYRNLVGEHTSVKISKKGDHFDASVNTKEDSNEISL